MASRNGLLPFITKSEVYSRCSRLSFTSNLLKSTARLAARIFSGSVSIGPSSASGGAGPAPPPSTASVTGPGLRSTP